MTLKQAVIRAIGGLGEYVLGEEHAAYRVIAEAAFLWGVVEGIRRSAAMANKRARAHHLIREELLRMYQRARKAALRTEA